MSTYRSSSGAKRAPRRTPPRAPVRAMQVIEELADAAESVTLATLSTTLDLPKTSLMHLLRALVASAHVQRTESGFVLGERSYRLAARITSADFFETASEQVLQKVRQTTLESTLLGFFTEDRKAAAYTVCYTSPQPIRFVPQLGDRRPLHATALGKLLLAYSPEDFVNDYLASAKLERFTPETLTTKTALRKRFREIREAGISISIDESTEGGAAMAAPVFDRSGKIHCGLLIALPSSRVRPNQALLTAALVDGAAKLSALLGHAARKPA